MRTCVGCRRVFPKRDLVRLVREGREVRVDDRGRAPGRGAYLCTDRDCVPRAREAGVKRALGGPLDARGARLVAQRHEDGDDR